MILAVILEWKHTIATHHFKSPDPSYPDFQFSFNALDIFKLNALPPATASRLSPEQEKLLGHSDCVAICEIVALDIGSKSSESDTADHGLVRFSSPMAPGIVVIETATQIMLAHFRVLQRQVTHPAVNISIKCCSVVPGSSLFRRPEKIPFCFSKASPAARLTSIISCCSISRRGGMA